MKESLVDRIVDEHFQAWAELGPEEAQKKKRDLELAIKKQVKLAAPVLMDTVIDQLISKGAFEAWWTHIDGEDRDILCSKIMGAIQTALTDILFWGIDDN